MARRFLRGRGGDGLGWYRRETIHDGTQSFLQSFAGSMMLQGRNGVDGMLRSIVVVPGAWNVVPTICYGTGGGEGMDGDQRCEEEAGEVM